MFGLSFGHLVIILFIILLMGGAKRLPELGGALGKGMRAFKKGLEGDDQARIDEDRDKSKGG